MRVMETANQKAIICAAFSLASLTGCATLRNHDDPMTVVRQKFAAFDRHDTPAIQNLYAADAVLNSPDYPELHGNVQIGDTYQRLLKAVPDARDEVQSLDLSGQKVYAQFFLIGHWMGSADNPIRVPILSVYTVRAGHIVADATYYDRRSH
jgi:ketosteroid isomerase-like protein